MSKLPAVQLPDLGGYLREQRQSAQLSLRQLADVSGISNPYLSQIERGLKKPSAEILQSLAKALRISAESLYVRAGILDAEGRERDEPATDVRAAIHADRHLTDRQRRVLLDVYESFVGEHEQPAARPPRKASAAQSRKAAGTSTSAKTGASARPRKATQTSKTTQTAK